jgi:hypothetical protein
VPRGFNTGTVKEVPHSAGEGIGLRKKGASLQTRLYRDGRTPGNKREPVLRFFYNPRRLGVEGPVSGTKRRKYAQNREKLIVFY